MISSNTGYLQLTFCIQGFCTWDAFYSSVDSDKVSSGLDSLRDAGVTVKYVILDDGWQSTALSSKGKNQDKDKSRAVKDKKLVKSSTSNTKTQEDLVEHSSDHDSSDTHKHLDSSVVLVGKHADTEEDDGELSGAQIDGNLAAQKMLEKETSVIVQFLTQVSTCTSTSSSYLYSWHCHVSHPHISITWYELCIDRSDIYSIRHSLLH
jgi:hypothetical protein